jgi:hypothetical protein
MEIDTCKLYSLTIYCLLLVDLELLVQLVLLTENYLLLDRLLDQLLLDKLQL